LANGNEMIETFSVFGLLVNEAGNAEQCVISFSSTQIKAYKGWMTRAQGLQVVTDDGRQIRLPLFATQWRLRTRRQQNDKGTWYGWVIDFDGDNAEEARVPGDSALYQVARSFRAAAMEFAEATLSRMTQEAVDADGDAM
jgi:hypothetical protein